MSDRPRLVGINHVALEVGDLEEALEFYGSIFDVRLRGREPGMAFVDMGDQFIALSAGRTDPPDGPTPLRPRRRRQGGRARGAEARRRGDRARPAP
jgi:catechol 2,3-dioxygenase-like lactoylglutathione lyase family enzyme